MNRIKQFTTIFIFLLFTFFLNGQSNQLTWDYNTPRELTYNIHQERGILDEGVPEDIEDHLLKLIFQGGGVVNIEYDGVLRGSFSVNTGYLEIVNANDLPPYHAVMLLSLFPVQGINGTVGDQWLTVFPSDNCIATEDDKVCLQDQYNVQIESIQNNLYNLKILTKCRVVQTSRLEQLLDGDISNSPILDWNLFLTGTSVFDATNKALNSAELYYILMPEVGYTEDSIRNSVHRQYVTISLEQ